MTSAITPCPLCGASIGAGDHACPNCHATPPQQDYVRAIDFARHQFGDWQRNGIISPEQLQHLQNHFQTMRDPAQYSCGDNHPLPPDAGLASPSTCWRCNRAVGRAYAYCNRCGAPLAEKADRRRYLNFVLKQIETAADVLTPSQAQACISDLRAQLASLQAEMEAGELRGEALAAARLADPTPDADPSSDDVSPIFSKPPAASAKRRSILEILLDPRNIQWLLGSGGGLLVVGLVIWLASLGFFKNPLIVAACMGAGTLALMAGGCAIIKLTRYELAGRAITLLACLAMPLNLWFYHAHALITLDGHLWMPALICCVLYATAAMVLEDPVFVYVLSAGVAMTGLLFLADLHKLTEIASPAALLVTIGLILLHAERAFPQTDTDTDTPFSRKRFGMACFWSAQALLGAGLIVLLGAQMGALFYDWLPMAANWLPTASTIVTDPGQRLLAVILVVAGAYAYVYSDLVVRRNGLYVYLAAGALLWAEALVIDLAHLSAQPCAFIGALALTSLLVNIIQSIGSSRTKPSTNPHLTRPLAPLAIFLSAAALAMGTILQLRSTQIGALAGCPYPISWSFPGAMAFAAACAAISAYLNARRSSSLTAPYLIAAAAAALFSAAESLSLIGIHNWATQSSILMLIPTAFLIASRFFRDQPLQRPLAAIAQFGTLILVGSAIWSAGQSLFSLESTSAVFGNLQMALLFAEAAAFYITSAILVGGTLSIYLAAAMGSAAVWQLLGYHNIPAEYHALAFASLGLILLLADRLFGLETSNSPLARPAIRCASVLLSLSAVSMALMAMSRIAVGSIDWKLAISLGIFSVLPLMAAGLVRTSSLRRWYISTAVGEFLLTCIAIEQQSQLTLWQNIEICSVALGLLMLAIGYALWYIEQEHHSDAASFCLGIGSLLATVPLAIAAVIYRFGPDISLPNEFALATISILMFVSGFMCRLRAPTLVGAALLALHLAMLLISAGMRAQLAVGIYLALGGAALFATGLLLSVYRDRLLAMPQKIREHEGVFQVLTWR